MTKPPSDDKLPDEKPARSYWQLMPRRSLTRVILLVAILLLIISFQRQGSDLAKRIADVLLPPPPPAARHDGGAVIHLKPVTVDAGGDGGQER